MKQEAQEKINFIEKNQKKNKTLNVIKIKGKTLKEKK